jgi:exonuclease VII small subunit
MLRHSAFLPRPVFPAGQQQGVVNHFGIDLDFQFQYQARYPIIAHTIRVRPSKEPSMNENMKYGLFLLGGVAIGALGAVALGKGKIDLKPVVTDLLGKGIDLKEKVMTTMETARENMEDLMAEATHAAETRKAAQETTPEEPAKAGA